MKINFKSLFLFFGKDLDKKGTFSRDYEEIEISKAFGYALKKIRNYKGLSLEKLSKEVDIPNPTINRYENGVNIPTITQAIKLSDYFNMSIELMIYFGLVGIYENEDIIPLYRQLEHAFEQLERKRNRK